MVEHQYLLTLDAIELTIFENHSAIMIKKTFSKIAWLHINSTYIHIYIASLSKGIDCNMAYVIAHFLIVPKATYSPSN